jgi:hypothetical protein
MKGKQKKLKPHSNLKKAKGIRKVNLTFLQTWMKMNFMTMVFQIMEIISLIESYA